MKFSLNKKNALVWLVTIPAVILASLVMAPELSRTLSIVLGFFMGLYYPIIQVDKV